jgi:hypothetical protein
MTIKGGLLAGVSICTICAGAAFAKTAPLVAQMRPGHAVVKTAVHPGVTPANLTSTASVSTGVSTSADYKKKTNLLGTFYTFLHSGTFCNEPKEKAVLTSGKKTSYAKLSTGSVSYSEGCGSPSKFYGDIYDLQKKTGAGKTDSFSSALKAHKVVFGGTTYKHGTLNLNVHVQIGS